jgi:hypothetical protein
VRRLRLESLGVGYLAGHVRAERRNHAAASMAAPSSEPRAVRGGLKGLYTVPEPGRILATGWPTLISHVMAARPVHHRAARQRQPRRLSAPPLAAARAEAEPDDLGRSPHQRTARSTPRPQPCRRRHRRRPKLPGETPQTPAPYSADDHERPLKPFALEAPAPPHRPRVHTG